MKKLLRDNGLLFDRPWSYWTIEMVVQSGIYMAMRIDEITPLWFAWITALNNAVWVFIFMKGGGWNWIKKKMPERWSPAAKRPRPLRAVQHRQRETDGHN